MGSTVGEAVSIGGVLSAGCAAAVSTAALGVSSIAVGRPPAATGGFFEIATDGGVIGDRRSRPRARAAPSVPHPAKAHRIALLLLRPGIVSDHGATEPGAIESGATEPGDRRVSSRSGGDGGMASALCERPAAWMMPTMRSTVVFARFGANGESARASSATLG